jgi:hypothetical protein
MLIESLRRTSAVEQKFVRSQIEAAARFTSKLFNPDYATLLAKAAEIAAQAAPQAAANN